VTEAAGAVERGRAHRLPLAIPITIGGAWALALVAEATGEASSLHHDALLSNLQLQSDLLLFLLAWQVMVAAMMLPSSLPLIQMFRSVTARNERPGAVTAAFLGGYGLVWAGFGLAALVFDLVVHQVVDTTPFLADRPWLIGGSALLLAGAFQFSDLKDRCLHQCRHPGLYLMRHYRRGAAAGFRLGRDHGWFCLGCCWALMLLMFAAGIANLVWMAVLTAVMVYEKVGRHGRRLTPIVGVTLLVWAVLVFAHPGWLPEAFAGTT
jgi:predicted metal-binding membrane protein